MRWLVVVAAVIGCGGDQTAPSAFTGLWLVGVPTSIDSGAQFTVVVELRDAQGEVVTGARNIVSLTLSPAPSAFSGPRSVRAVDGVATFAGLVIHNVASTVYFTASAGSLTAPSATFAVTPANP